MLESIFSWILMAAFIFAFFLAYGMVEDLIRQWRNSRSTRRNHCPSVTDLKPPQACSSSEGLTAAARGYDSPRLHREDTLIRIKRLEAEIAAHKRNIDGILKSMKRSAPEEDLGKPQ